MSNAIESLPTEELDWIMRQQAIEGVEITSAICITKRTGLGFGEYPVRQIKQYWTTDGNFIGEINTS